MRNALKICLLFLFYSVTGIAQQDTVTQYLDTRKQICAEDYACYIRSAKRIDGGWLVKDFYWNERSLAMQGFYLDDSFKIENGRFHYYSREGQLTSSIYFVHGKRNGLVKAYSNGILTDSSFYKNDIPCGFTYGFNESGKLTAKGVFDNDGNGTGTITVFYDNGNLSVCGKYSTGYLKDSIWNYFLKNGELAYVQIYDKGTLLKSDCFNSNGQSIGKCDSEVWPKPSVDIGAFISQHLIFPKKYNLIHDEIKVVASFVVDETGNVTDITITHKIHPAFDSAVIDVLKKMPRWKPARQYNRPVKVAFTIPVKFKQTD